MWLNTESIPKGGQWQERMEKGLEETDLMILVVSPDAMKSDWVRREWKTFLKNNKRVLPVEYRECKVPSAIKALQRTKTDGAGWYYRLLKAIEQNL